MPPRGGAGNDRRGAGLDRWPSAIPSAYVSRLQGYDRLATLLLVRGLDRGNNSAAWLTQPGSGSGQPAGIRSAAAANSSILANPSNRPAANPVTFTDTLPSGILMETAFDYLRRFG